MLFIDIDIGIDIGIEIEIEITLMYTGKLVGFFSRERGGPWTTLLWICEVETALKINAEA